MMLPTYPVVQGHFADSLALARVCKGAGLDHFGWWALVKVTLATPKAPATRGKTTATPATTTAESAPTASWCTHVEVADVCAAIEDVKRCQMALLIEKRCVETGWGQRRCLCFLDCTGAAG